MQGVSNTAEAAKSAGVERLVLVSSALVTPKNRFHPIRLILNNIRWGLMDAKFRGEELLRASSVPYTVVRPGTSLLCDSFWISVSMRSPSIEMSVLVLLAS